MKNLKDRANSAVVHYLELNEYTVLERDWKHGDTTIDVIAEDSNGTLCFIAVFVDIYDGNNSFDNVLSGNSDEKRKQFEKLSLAYLMNYEKVNVPVRYDEAHLMVLGTDRAMLRYHVCAIS